jgi:hypothetical protein
VARIAADVSYVLSCGPMTILGESDQTTAECASDAGEKEESLVVDR